MSKDDATLLEENGDNALSRLLTELPKEALTQQAYKNEQACFNAWFAAHPTLKPITEASGGAPKHKRTVFLASVQLWLGYGRNANYGKRDAKGNPLMDEAALSVKVQERLSDAARKGWVYDGLQPKSILSKLSAIYSLYTKQRALNGYADDESDPVKDYTQDKVYGAQLKMVLKKVDAQMIKDAKQLPVGDIGEDLTIQHKEAIRMTSIE